MNDIRKSIDLSHYISEKVVRDYLHKRQDEIVDSSSEYCTDWELGQLSLIEDMLEYLDDVRKLD